MSNPLAHWLAGGPCPPWCGVGCGYRIEGDGTYSRTHVAQLVGAADKSALHVELSQHETAHSPDDPHTECLTPSVELFLAAGDVNLGTPADAAPRLRQIAADLLNAADQLEGCTP